MPFYLATTDKLEALLVNIESETVHTVSFSIFKAIPFETRHAAKLFILANDLIGRYKIIKITYEELENPS